MGANGAPGVMFLQSQTYFGADSNVHALIMRGLDRNEFQVHAATNCRHGSCPCEPRSVLEAIPGVSIRPTRFPPTREGRTRWELAHDATYGGPASAASLAGLIRHVRRRGVRIVHCTEKPRDALTGWAVARAGGARLVIHVHVKAEGWIDRRVRRVMGHADALIGVSDFVAESLAELGYDRSRIHSVRNGMDFSGWHPAPATGEDVRSEFDIPADRPIVTIVARVFKWKGHELLLRAMAQLPADARRPQLLVVGDDDPRAHPGGGSFTAELEVLAGRLGVDSHVTFTGYRTDVRRLMAASDVYAMPSVEEPFGMVFLEAMALGKPVVALRSGGVPEVVEQGETGLLSEPDDVGGLATNLRRLLVDEGLRHEMGCRGRERAVRLFTHERMARDTTEVYRQVIDQADDGRSER